MKSRHRKSLFTSTLLMIAVIAFILAGVGTAFESALTKNARKDAELRAIEKINVIGSHMGDALNSHFETISELFEILSNWGVQVTPDRLDKINSRLLTRLPYFYAIVYAPELKVEYIWPEKLRTSLNDNHFTHFDIDNNPYVKRALETNEAVIRIPNLKQWKSPLISYIPLKYGNKEGIATISLNFDALTLKILNLAENSRISLLVEDAIGERLLRDDANLFGPKSDKKNYVEHKVEIQGSIWTLRTEILEQQGIKKNRYMILCAILIIWGILSLLTYFIMKLYYERSLQAQTDGMTGLLNHSHFNETVREVLSKKTERNCALLVCDLNRFKDINDQYGHEAGDLVICEAATRLESCIRNTDVIGRIGGDEFCILLINCTYENAEHINARIAHEFSKPVKYAGNELNVGVSVGIAMFPEEGDNFKELFKKADIKMYRHKEEAHAQSRS